MRKVLTFLFLILFNFKLVFAEISNEEKILQYMMTPAGEVSKEIHDLFWSGVKKKMTIEQLKEFKTNPDSEKTLDRLISLQFYRIKIELQKNFWESVQASYDTKTIYKTKKYKNSKEEYDLINTSQFYLDREKKNISNKMFDEYLERLFTAAANNSQTFLDLDLKREEFSRNYITKKIIQSLIFVDRYEKISDPSYYEK